VSAVNGERWSCGADMLMTLERLDGTTLGDWSTRAELLMGIAPVGTRRHSAAVMPSTPPPFAEMLDCEALGGIGMRPGCPTAARVAAACSSVCEVVVGGAAKLGAADGAVLVVMGLRHLSSVMSSVGKQIDKMYASESAVGSPFLMASPMDVWR